MLTQPSAVEEVAAAPGIGGSSATGEDPSRPVRVVAYLTNEEAQQMEQVWLHMRMQGLRPSKADIVRAALLYALENKDPLADALKRQTAADAAAGRPTANIK
jgi:hypothetical protein